MQRIVEILLLCLMVLPIVRGQDEISLQINSSSNVHYIVTNSRGQRTGADPRDHHAARPYAMPLLGQIPRANYSFSGTGDDQNSPEFSYNAELPADSGTYQIQVFGMHPGVYWLSVCAVQTIGDSSKQWMFEVRGVIDHDSAVAYRLTLPATLDMKVDLLKIISPSSLIQDIAAMQKLKWIKRLDLANRYSLLITTYATQLQARDVLAAQSTLKTFMRNVSSASGKVLSPEATQFLLADAEILMAQQSTIR